MRLWAVVVCCVAVTASAQTRLDASVTAGLNTTFSPDALSAEAALRLDASRQFQRFTVFTALAGTFNSRFSMADLGSVVGIGVRAYETIGLRLQLFPFSSLRVRDTFDFANFVGRPIRLAPVEPTLRVAVEHRFIDVWCAVSGYPVRNDLTLEDEIAWTGRLGFAARLPLGLTLEGRAAAHYRGLVPALATQGIERDVVAITSAGRLGWAYGGGVSQQVDLFTYAADPERFERFFVPEAYDTPVAAWIGLEGGAVSQNLTVPNTLETERYVTGYADVQARLRIAEARFFLIGRLHSLDFLFFDTPGFPPFQLIDRSRRTEPRLAAYVGADYRIEGLDLEIGVQLRIVRSAVLHGPQRSTVHNSADTITILPMGVTSPQPIIGAMGTLRYSPARFLSVIGAADYEREASATRFSDPTSMEPVFVPRDTVRLKLYAQVNF